MSNECFEEEIELTLRYTPMEWAEVCAALNEYAERIEEGGVWMNSAVDARRILEDLNKKVDDAINGL